MRPDGDIESKTIAWCLDNGFFEVEPGLWSGPWYDAARHAGTSSSANGEGDGEGQDESNLYSRAELMEARHQAKEMQVEQQPRREEAIFTDDYMKLESQMQLMQARDYAEKRRSRSPKKLLHLRQVVTRGMEALTTGDCDAHEEVVGELLSGFKEDADAFLVGSVSCYMDSVEPGSAIDYVYRLLSLHARLNERLLQDLVDLVGYWCDVPWLSSC